MMPQIRVAVVGSEHQALRRARIVATCPGAVVTVVVSTAGALAPCADAPETAGEWQEAISREGIDAVLVCTPLRMRPMVSIAAMKAGKHVLCDQPIAETMEAAEAMVETARRSRVVLGYGCQDRHRRAIRRVQEWIREGVIGQPMVVHCRRGSALHDEDGGISTVEALAELDARSADLAHWLLGDFIEVVALARRPTKDTTAAILKGRDGKVAVLHSCLLETRDAFSVEVVGRDGYAEAGDVGGGFGRELARFGRRNLSAPFRETVVEFAGEDTSRRTEFQVFAETVRTAYSPADFVHDGIEALRLMLAVRESERSGTAVPLA